MTSFCRLLSFRLLRTNSIKLVGSRNLWQFVPLAPPDPILGLTEAFKRDSAKTKVLLGAGTYRDDDGKPLVLDCVHEAERRILNNKSNHEYAGIDGIEEFTKLAIRFAYGEDSSVLRENRVAAVQTLSGTGACRLAGEFFGKFLGKNYPIYLPNPTWGNHIPIMQNSGLDVRKYRFYDPLTCGLNLNGMLEDIVNAPEKSIFLFHACAHNPTGVDPTHEQWREISNVVKNRNHISFFDCAYQGFASGNADVDAFSLRHFVSEGHNIILAQSFAKNFGLYGERVGALSFVCHDLTEAERVKSQLKILIRPMYSNPPIYGAKIVQTILSDPELTNQWKVECEGMANRIKQMRFLLKSALEQLGSRRNWQHLTDQIGMFCFTGLTPEQVDLIREKHHIYCTRDGRISVSGINTKNVEYIARAIHDITSQ